MMALAAPVSVVFLMTMTLVSIFTASLYVPSLPRIADEFETTPAGAQATLTVFVVIFALVQLWHGPASDRLEHWHVLRLSLVVFLLGTTTCTWAPTLDVLIGGRILQGLGAADIAVLPRAIAQYAFGSTPRGTQVFVYLSMAAAVGAALAPQLGGWLDELTGTWQADFVLLAAMGAGTLAMAARSASRLAGARSDRLAGLRGVIGDCRALMRHRRFSLSVIGGGTMRAGYFGFLTAAPVLLADAYSVRPALVGTLMAALTVAILLANFVVSRLSKQHGPVVLTIAGAMISLLAPVAMAVAALAESGVIWAIAVPIALFGFGQGIAVPMSNILAVRTDPRMAGTAASLLGFWTHMLGAAGTIAAGFLGTRDALPLALLIGVAVLAALGCFLGLQRRSEAPLPV